LLGGYAGKLVFIDLTNDKVAEGRPSPDIYRDFIGGTVLGIRIPCERMKLE